MNHGCRIYLRLALTPVWAHSYIHRLSGSANEFELFLRHNSRGGNWYYESTSLSLSVSSHSKPTRRSVGDILLLVTRLQNSSKVSVKLVRNQDDKRLTNRTIAKRPPTHTPLYIREVIRPHCTTLHWLIVLQHICYELWDDKWWDKFIYWQLGGQDGPRWPSDCLSKAPQCILWSLVLLWTAFVKQTAWNANKRHQKVPGGLWPVHYHQLSNSVT